MNREDIVAMVRACWGASKRSSAYDAHVIDDYHARGMGRAQHRRDAEERTAERKRRLARAKREGKIGIAV